MDQVVAHIQAYYCLTSLGTQLEIVVSYLHLKLLCVEKGFVIAL